MFHVQILLKMRFNPLLFPSETQGIFKAFCATAKRRNRDDYADTVRKKQAGNRAVCSKSEVYNSRQRSMKE